MPNFEIKDISTNTVAGFIHVKGAIDIPDIQGKKPPYSKYPFFVFVKAKRIGTNDFYYTKANLNSNVNGVLSLFDAAIQLPGSGRNYKIWVEVMSEHDSLGTKSDELNINVD